jgi:hypothetical protein
MWGWFSMSKSEVAGIWRNMPIYRLVLEILARRPEGVTERELLTLLKKEYGLAISKKELYQALLKLEINGYIKVEPVGKNIVASLTSYVYKVFGNNRSRRS